MNAIALATQLEATTPFPPEALVTIENLQVCFGEVVAVESLDLTVRRGEFVSLLGPSGCGKSTLLPWRTTLDNVLLPVEIQLGGSVVDQTDQVRARRMLDMVQLGDFLDAYPHQLSGGMQQRAALARALMSDPDILLLDEPFGALDELTREVLNEELIRIWQSNATRLQTIIMVTHSISEAVTMSDRVIVLTDRPARLVEDVQVGRPRPRALEDPEAAVVMKRIRAMVRGRR
jgi:NitT/TauT family transport system ATP-binding protein